MGASSYCDIGQFKLLDGASLPVQTYKLANKKIYNLTEMAGYDGVGDFSKEMQKQTLVVVDGITQATFILYYHILSH